MELTGRGRSSSRRPRVWTAPLGAAAFAVVGLVCLLAPRPAAGHALWVTPPPRDQQDGYKDPPRAPPGTGAPCGIGRASGQPVTSSLVPGQPVTVTWRETVTHPGCFVIDFAEANDANFTVLGVKSHANPPAPSTPRDWSLGITIPNVSCAACTLRVRQLMLAADLPDAQCPPSTIPAGATYYSCANIQLGSGSPSDAAVSGTDAGPTADAGASGGGGAAGQNSAGGGCTIGGGEARIMTPILALAFAALVLRRRRR